MSAEWRGASAYLSRIAATLILCAIYRAAGTMLDLLCSELDWWGTPWVAIAHAVRPLILLYGGVAAIWCSAVVWSRRRLRWAAAVTLGVLTCSTGVIYLSAIYWEEWPYTYAKDLNAILCGLALMLLARVCFSPMQWELSLTMTICPKCGYDLRCCRECRCPECGEPFVLRDVVRTVRAWQGDV